MSRRPEEYYSPLKGDAFGRFVNKRVDPPINTQKLHMDLLSGDDRLKLKTPVTGDLSLVLRYKGKEGFVTSMGDEGEAISILQFQGALRGEGYRVSSGLLLVPLFASQIHEISSHPDAPYRELYMPVTFTIEGLEVAKSGNATARYESLAAELGLKFSHDELRYVKKTR